GSNLSQTSRTWRNEEIVNGKLPTQLDNVGVNINGKPAFVYYISPTQLNVQAPADDSAGPLNVGVGRGAREGRSGCAQIGGLPPRIFPLGRQVCGGPPPRFQPGGETGPVSR